MNLLSEKNDRLLRNIARMAETFVNEKGIVKNKRILIPTSYLQVQFNRIVDYILSIGLKLRGAEIVPILCNGFHDEQCPVWAGTFVNDFPSQCRETCNFPAHLLWEEILGYNAPKLTEYRMNGDREIAEKAMAGINYKNYREYTFDDYDVGCQVAEVVANCNNLSEVLPGNQFENELLLHGMNTVKMILAYSRLIKKVQPDVIVGSLHDHYQWSTLYHVARKAGVSYYSHTMVEEPGSVHFGKNVDKVCEVSDAWPSFRDTPVEPEIWKSFDRYMDRKAAGKSTCFNIYPAVGAKELEELKSKLDISKPVAFFPSNVPWDSAIHNYCFVSGDKEIIQLIHKTVSYFNRHPEFQLIIKAHPYEQVFKDFQFLPHTLKRILENLNAPLGPNIFFIDADSPISIFDIYPLADLGIVHSSRSGCELAMHGVPVILAGDNHYRSKGFTLDVANESEFYESIQGVLSGCETRQTINERIKLSRKYWLLYNSHGFVNLGLFNQGWTKPVELLFDRLEEFLPGNNHRLDYICDAILTGKPIFGDSRWPPISFPEFNNDGNKRDNAHNNSTGKVKLSKYWKVSGRVPDDINSWIRSYHSSINKEPAYEYIDLLAQIQDFHDDCYVPIRVPLDTNDSQFVFFNLNLAKAQQLWHYMHPFENFPLVRWMLDQKYIEKYIDIGAHIGSMAIPLAKLSPRIRTVAVEPVPENYTDLKRNIELNGLKNVEIVKAAAYSKTGTAEFFINALHDGRGGLFNNRLHGTGEIFVSPQRLKKDYPAVKQEIEVKAITLDELVDDQLSLVKIDADGYDSEVLLSGIESLKRGRIQSLLISTNRSSCEETYRILKEYFLEISSWIPDTKRIELMDENSAKTATNLLCKIPSPLN
jgi:FkbM family methyltransferase